MRTSLSTVALLSVLALGATGCSKSLKTLAKGDGKLASDAKAVIAALKGSGIEPKAVKVFDRGDPPCDGRPPCAGVCVIDERIVGLCVSGAKAVDLAALGGADQLQRLELRSSLRGTVALKGGLEELERLELSENRLEAFSVEGLSRLRELALTTSRIKRLSLSGLPKLVKLRLPNGINRITMKQVGMRSIRLLVPHLAQLTLTDLPSVQRVSVSGRLRKVELSKLPALTRLDLADNKLEQLKLENLPALRRLDLERNKLVVLKLSKLPALRRVDLKENKLVVLELSKLPALRQLDLKENKLEVVELAQLPALSSVDLRNNKLKKLPTITGAPALKTLRLPHNKLTTLAGLETLSVKTLYVEYNALTSLDPAVAAAPAAKKVEARSRKGASKSASPKGAGATSQVETLIATYNKISSLAGLSAYPKLTYLAVDNNRLRSLEGVEQAPKLKTLRATFNKLKTIEGAQKLPELRLLYVSYNQLATLKPLDIAKLHTLYADNNKLSKPEEIFGAEKKKRPKIKRYDLRSNALKGVAAGLLVYGLARAARPGRRHRARGGRRGGGYRGSRGIRSRGSRYSSGGGYRSGK